MLRKLVLLFILICSTGIAYGQHDYRIRERDINGMSVIFIESKNGWERRIAFLQGKTRYQWSTDDLEYWGKKVKEMRQSYIPSTILQKMVESDTQISAFFVADYQGKMIDVYLSADSHILTMLSKEQLIEIYKKI